MRNPVTPAKFFKSAQIKQPFVQTSLPIKHMIANHGININMSGQILMIVFVCCFRRNKMPRNISKKIEYLKVQLSGNNVRLYAFVTFMTLVSFMGGSSRDDVQSLVFLRPLAVLFGAYALTCMSLETWKGRTFPLCVAVTLAGLMLLQLIPLPPQMWTALPGRQAFADIAILADIEQPWRPLTLSPSRTLNSLFSLSVPIAAIMLYLNLDERHRRQAVAVIIILAGISVLFGALQLGGSPRGPLYLYNITNNGSAVGLFANRNHQAILLATTIVMLGWYGASHAASAKLAALKFYGSIGAIFVIVPLLFITGSRAGLILMAPALVAAMMLIYFGQYMIERQPQLHRHPVKKKAFTSRQAILISSIVLVLIMAGLSVYFARSLAFDRLFGRGDVEELRSQLVPILTTMMSDYFPWGSGFGSFEHVYRIYEPQELLNPAYLNQAHNDWLQFFIEGGLPAMLIAIGTAVWATIGFSRLAQSWRYSRYTKYRAAMAAMVILLILMGSAGDYPLRVPSLVSIFAVIACMLVDSINDTRKNALKAT